MLDRQHEPEPGSRQDDEWVRAAYRGLLERDGDRDGIRHWNEFLAKGGTPADLLKLFARSDEFLSRTEGAWDPAGMAAIIRAAYRGLLDREPDKAGDESWRSYLQGGGSVTELLRQIAVSDEYLNLSEERANRRAREIIDSLPSAGRKIAILSNCQGGNLARCMQALTGTRPPTFISLSLDYVRGKESAAALRAVYDQHDLVLAQPVFLEEILKRNARLRDKSMLWPSITFAAFQPDQCFVRVRHNQEQVTGPLGPYHSSIAYFAWRKGLSRERTVKLFCADVYEELRFFSYWDSAERALLDEGARSGMPLDSLLRKWRMRGCFMFSPTHPKLYVLADLARLLLQRLEVPVLPLDPEELVHDRFIDAAVWPVYPEIGERYGIQGGYVFKGNNPGVPTKSPLLLYGLEEFVARSFEAYEVYSRKADIYCDRLLTERYEKAFAKTLRAAPAQPAPRPPRPSLHPYSHLPARNYWHSAVAQTPAGDVDPVTAPGFRIDRNTRVATAGSCFAQHISRHLRLRGFNYLVSETAPAGMTEAEARRRNFGVYSARYGNLYSARQLLQLFDRAYGRLAPADDAWVRPDGRYVDPFRPEIEPAGFADAQAVRAELAGHFEAVRCMFESLDVFVFTLGLTECWSAVADGAVFPLAPGVVAGEVSPTRYRFLNLSVEEVTADLEAFLLRLHEVNASARLVLTVSPVPLAATFEKQHVLAATTYSKAVLRAAAETMARRHPQCCYFPSYEIVTGAHNRGAYFEADLRSITPAGVDQVMRLFFQHLTDASGGGTLDQELLDEAQRAFKIICEEDLLAAAV